MKEGSVKDFLAFRRMLTPMIVVGLFWLGMVLCVIGGIVQIVIGLVARYGHGGITVLVGILTMVIGPVLVRLWCEVVLLFFRMNESLTDIKNSLDKLESKEDKQERPLV